MLSPFPGIDPYLENPELWSAVHNRIIVAIADSLVDHREREVQGRGREVHLFQQRQ